MSLISFFGSGLLHVIVVRLYHCYIHRHPTTPLRRGLFCPRAPEPTRTISCSEGAPASSAELSPIHIQVPDYSTKSRNLTPTQSQKSLRAKFNIILASYQEINSTAPPVEALQNPGNLSRSTSMTMCSKPFDRHTNRNDYSDHSGLFWNRWKSNQNIFFAS